MFSITSQQERDLYHHYAPSLGLYSSTNNPGTANYTGLQSWTPNDPNIGSQMIPLKGRMKWHGLFSKAIATRLHSLQSICTGPKMIPARKKCPYRKWSQNWTANDPRTGTGSTDRKKFGIAWTPWKVHGWIYICLIILGEEKTRTSGIKRAMKNAVKHATQNTKLTCVDCTNFSFWGRSAKRNRNLRRCPCHLIISGWTFSLYTSYTCVLDSHGLPRKRTRLIEWERPQCSLDIFICMPFE